MSRLTTTVLGAGALVLGATLGVSAVQNAGGRAPVQFRAGVTMVPIDVRVLDRHGQPVTDLSRADFTIIEDGVPQTIQQFLRASLEAEPAAAHAPLAAGPMSDRAAALAPQTRRIFLIVLGRGRLTGPVKVLDALTTFVRERLLPQDQVAVVGYNRATDFTTDHDSIAEVLTRYEQKHTEIEALIAQNQNLVMGVLGPDDMPPFLQDRIDTIFGTGVYGAITLPSPGSDVRRAEARAGDDLEAALRLEARDGSLTGLGVAMDTGLLGNYYEDYLGHAVAALTDLGNVHKGLDYLRHVDGEKHLLLVTVDGSLGLYDSRDEDRLAALASDARVALNMIHTAGVVAAPPAGARGPIPAVPTPSQVFNQTFSVRGLRAMADLSGGQAWAFQTGDHATARLDLATRFQYVLGYVPTNASWDGRYREVRVDVTRPDVRVIYRHGYYATPDERRAGRDPDRDSDGPSRRP